MHQAQLENPLAEVGEIILLVEVRKAVQMAEDQKVERSNYFSLKYG
jgi:hypothetical protein